ncbi:DUF4150 domain-containing protein [uncultured Paracoccus sp.]|uniref:DUF4150 domain-containing protein n=1 Tax=uncultured Paracoccus sp. TaxID=189685 RepID=UPI0026040C4F|nr:DUF4150 domain-containing protein [uncultured Paracoccus sp.]
MSNVFANGLEISGKAVDAKTIAAFPDTCFTPPENPATPPGVPVPYPSFGFASDTEDGTGTVFIGGKTVNIKNKSDLTKTSGTEAGCAAKKGVITSKNTGKEYFNSWSNDVKFDGEPVIRMSDLATNNHASPAGNTCPWPHLAKVDVVWARCEQIFIDLKVHKHGDKTSACSANEESDHIMQNAYFTTGQRIERISATTGLPKVVPGSRNHYRRGWGSNDSREGYRCGAAPAICLEEQTGNGTAHDLKTTKQKQQAAAHQAAGRRSLTFAEAKQDSMDAMVASGKIDNPSTEYDCISDLIDAVFESQMGIGPAALEKKTCRVPGVVPKAILDRT